MRVESYKLKKPKLKDKLHRVQRLKSSGMRIVNFQILALT